MYILLFTLMPFKVINWVKSVIKTICKNETPIKDTTLRNFLGRLSFIVVSVINIHKNVAGTPSITFANEKHPWPATGKLESVIYADIFAV